MYDISWVKSTDFGANWTQGDTIVNGAASTSTGAVCLEKNMVLTDTLKYFGQAPTHTTVTGDKE